MVDWMLDDVERRTLTLDPDRLSPGARRFGAEMCVRHLVDLGRAHPGPIVSVGSGCAYLEYAAYGGDDRCICVDPDAPYALIVPHYPTVEDLVRARPELVGACTLVCCWCRPNDSTYDAEAVRLLRPLAVLALIERDGGCHGSAGGRRFHIFLEAPDAHDPPYRTTHTTAIDGDYDDDGVKWVWLERADRPPYRPDLPTRARARCQSECVVA